MGALKGLAERSLTSFSVQAERQLSTNARRSIIRLGCKGGTCCEVNERQKPGRGKAALNDRLWVMAAEGKAAALSHLRAYLCVAVISYECFSDRWAGDSFVIGDRAVCGFG